MVHRYNDMQGRGTRSEGEARTESGSGSGSQQERSVAGQKRTEGKRGGNRRSAGWRENLCSERW